MADFNQLVDAYTFSLMNLQGTDPAAATEQLAALNAALATHQGTAGWVRQDALSMLATSWSYFLDQLAEFEQTYQHEDLLTRLSRLRQIGEESDLPGNDCAGAGFDVVNQVKRANRTPDPSRWSLLLEAKQVVLPDGEVVDIHHFLVTVESLIDDGRKSDARTVYVFGYPVAVGESYSALSWSGDIGGAVGDKDRFRSAGWEAASIKGRTEQERVDFYFRTRAPDMDLLPDIDGWGASWLVPIIDDGSPFLVHSLVELVTKVYGTADATPREAATARGINRARGIGALLTHYGFTSAIDLNGQTAAVARLEAQILIFSEAWFQAKAPTLVERAIPPTPSQVTQLKATSAEMRTVFLDWLQHLAHEYRALL